MTTYALDLDSLEMPIAPALPPLEGRPVTAKQVAFIKRLVDERDVTAILPQVEAARDAVMAQRFSTRQASALIDALLVQPRAAREPGEQAVFEEGFYSRDGETYKVVASQSTGHLYAKRLVLEADGGMEWVYAPGVVPTLTAAHRITAEQAAHLGQITGRCVFCSRTLTDERSIAVGYGPVCADHHGLPWGE